MKDIWTLLTVLFIACLATPSFSDDTEVFSGSTINVPPNVLIIFDTSGSMSTDMIPSSTYDPIHDYSSGLSGSPYLKNTVYYVWKEPSRPQEKPIYREFTGTTDNIACAEAKTSLETYGRWMGFIQATSPFGCSSSKVAKLFMGNYLNYLDSPSVVWELKLDIAKRVVSNLMNSIDDDAVRFGLMRYNKTHQGQGGFLLAPIGSTDTQINAQLDGLLVNTVLGGTPLAETLAEAGLYFAGRNSWSNKGETYTSPIQWRCQKNYVIFMTDGLSTDDEGENVEKENILTGTYNSYFAKAIGDYDHDGIDPQTTVNGGTHYIDDVAKFLYDEDLRPGSSLDTAGQSFDDPTFPTQNVTTYIIGFATGTDETLLEKAADSSHGNGAFYSTANSVELEQAFLSVVGSILATNASFIAPVVPVSRLNQVYSGDSVYLSLFKPIDGSAFWNGNVKKFGLNSQGQLLQKDGSGATDSSGQILESASSCWQYSSSDGSVTEKGGAGEVIRTQGTRNFYTNTGLSTALTHSSNAFSSANANITASFMGVSAESRADTIDFLTARGIYAPGGTSERDWVLGDILHSRPATMYDGNETILFVGSNDGFLHAFVDDGQGTVGTTHLGDDTLSEAWAFVPWDLVPGLHVLKDTTRHPYFIDSSPVLYRAGANQQVTFGLRRGGNKYYTLKVGEFNSLNKYISGGYRNPEWLWDIDSDILGTETLGQSWFKPYPCTISTGGSSRLNVLLLTGGYDDTNEDLATPASGDSRGRAVFAVNAADGGLVSNLNFNHGNYTDMDYSIIDLNSFDYNNDSLTDTIYAGSLGGDLFCFNDRDRNGIWDKKLVFQARDGATALAQLKFMYAPDVTLEAFGDFVFIGTGDREHPNETNTINRFYAIKNSWNTPWTPLTEANLVDVTSYAYTTETMTNLQNNDGWFIKLNGHAGEKVVSPPLVFNRIVFFTTFAPDPGNESDECSIQGLGGGRLYALDYLTGRAAINFNTSNDTDGVVLDTSDRSLSLGKGIPSPPTLVVTPEGAKLLVGTSGVGGTTGARTIDVPGGGKVIMYYWKEKPIH